jgi:hypothetical protein
MRLLTDVIIGSLPRLGKNIDVAFGCMNAPTKGPAAADAVRAFHPKLFFRITYRSSDLNLLQEGLEGAGVEVRLVDYYPRNPSAD